MDIDVSRIAKLVKLDIIGEQEKLSKMLSETLAYIANLDELNTKSVKETYQVTGLTNVFQQDNPHKNTLSQSEALSNVGDRVFDGLIVTQAILDK